MMLFKREYDSPTEILKQCERKLSEQCEKYHKSLFSAFKDLDKGWKRNATKDFSAIVCLSQVREKLKEVITSPDGAEKLKPASSGKMQYQVSSLFLKNCARYLTSDPSRHERLHLVTGTVTTDGTRVLSWMENVEFSEKSAGYVCADAVDSHNKIISLTENEGHMLLGVFHSHISKGANSTKPSGIDNAHLKRQAQIGCDCLGGIFSLDGYVRFFSMTAFDIDVYGKGVSLVEDRPKEKVFKIESLEDAS